MSSDRTGLDGAEGLVVDAMMARMGAERVVASPVAARLAALVGTYAGRVAPAVLDQHDGASVSSALGVWLLLAACASGAAGRERVALEDALGCPAEEASRLLGAFIADPPPALHAAIALWVAVDDETSALSAWAEGLPREVQSGYMPSQAEADAWAERETLGLIRKFPMAIDAMTRIVLASALATKVSWEVPFEVVAAAEGCAPGSPWSSAVSRVLWDSDARHHALITRTEAAGLVAVHCAVAQEDLTVVSVSAAPEVDRTAVLLAAGEVASTVCQEWGRAACSLFDLPLGSGHSWEISEREVTMYRPVARVEKVAAAALPAWSVSGELDLLRSPAFGTAPALETLRRLIGAGPGDRSQAGQTAVASFTRYGFHAAAITGLFMASAAPVAHGRGVERTAVLRFDHPYAAVAVAGRPALPRGPKDAPGVADTRFPGLPLFTAWVHEPIEPQDHPPGSWRGSPRARADP